MKPTNAQQLVAIPTNYQTSQMPCAKDFFPADEGNRIITVNYLVTTPFDATNTSFIFQFDLTPVFSANAIKSVRSVGVDLIVNPNAAECGLVYLDMPTIGDMMMLGYLSDSLGGDFIAVSAMREVVSGASGFLANLTFDSSFASCGVVDQMNLQISFANFKRTSFGPIASAVPA